MKSFLKENWFKVSIIVLATLFLYIYIQQHNYYIIGRAEERCGNHRVQSEGERCLKPILKYYIGNPPAFNFER